MAILSELIEQFVENFRSWVKEHRADHCPPSLPPMVKGACMESRRLVLSKKDATNAGTGRAFDGKWWDQNSPYVGHRTHTHTRRLTSPH